MAEETDGIEEALEGQLRLLVSAAAQAGERIARAREDMLRRAQAHSEQEQRELRSRVEAERRAARAEMTAVHRWDWWEHATPEQISHAYQVARAWSQEDPEALRAEQRMSDELRTRYGIDVSTVGADPQAVVQRIRRELDHAENERTSSDADRSQATGEHAEAQRLLTQADQEDQRAQEARTSAQHDPDPEEQERAATEAGQREATADSAREAGNVLYDSAERREATARDLEARGIDPEVVATRMRADMSQARPATEAVRTTTADRSPKARVKQGGRAAQAQRTGLQR